MEFAGRRMYVYCGKGGVAGVAADNGELLWDTTDWQIGTANVPLARGRRPGANFLLRRIRHRQPDAPAERKSKAGSPPGRCID